MKKILFPAYLLFAWTGCWNAAPFGDDTDPEVLTTDTGNSNRDTDADSDADTGTGTDTPANECPIAIPDEVCANMDETVLFLNNSNNYSYTPTLSATSIPVQCGSTLTDLRFDWQNLHTGLTGKSIGTDRSIDMLVVSVWRLGPDEFLDTFSRNALTSADRLGMFCAETDETKSEVSLLDMDFCYNYSVMDHIDEAAPYFDGTASDYDPALYTHAVTVGSGTTLYDDFSIQMLKLFTLDPLSTTTEIALDDQSASLKVEADLHTLTRVGMSVDKPARHIDWWDLSEDVHGTELFPITFARFVIAHFPMTACELEDSILDMESRHIAWYEYTLTEASNDVPPSQLTDANGNHFPGITKDGTWILALFTYAGGFAPEHPPEFMTILHPC